MSEAGNERQGEVVASYADGSVVVEWSDGTQSTLPRRPETLEDHLACWAPGNLQHHLAFEHGISAAYDGPLNELHAAAHRA